MSINIPRSFIDELLTRVDIVSVIETFVSLRKVGSNYVARCPFHQEKTASFVISPAKQIYHCFGCGVGGNAIGFLMEYDHLRFGEAVETLAAKIGMAVPQEFKKTSDRSSDQYDLYPLMEKIACFYQAQLKQHPRASQVLNYLHQRGLADQTIREFGIGYAPPGWNCLRDQRHQQTRYQQQLVTVGMLVKDQQKGAIYDRFRDRIMFPIRDRRGRVIAFGGRVLGDAQPKYLNSPETPIFHKGSELYGLYEVSRRRHDLQYLLVVEGYMDVIRLFQEGVTSAVATLGTATSAYHIERLFRICPLVIFCFDGDQAGKAAAFRALDMIIPVMRDHWQVKFMFLPDGEDPDTLVAKEGQAKFENRIKQAMLFSDFLFQHLKTQVQGDSVDSRARFAHLALAYLQKMPANVMRDMLFQKLSQHVAMEITQLKRYLKQSDQPSLETTPSLHFLSSSAKRALVLLVQNPQLAEAVPDTLPLLNIDEMTLFNKVVHVLKNNKSLPTGALLEYFREDPDGVYLTTLASAELMIPETGLLPEFVDLLQRLQVQVLEDHIERLMAKASLNGLSEDEKQRLQGLLHEKHKILS